MHTIIVVEPVQIGYFCISADNCPEEVVVRFKIIAFGNIRVYYIDGAFFTAVKNSACKHHQHYRKE
jgi:hypothetical protein